MKNELDANSRCKEWITTSQKEARKDKARVIRQRAQ